MLYRVFDRIIDPGLCRLHFQMVQVGMLRNVSLPLDRRIIQSNSGVDF